MDKMNAEKDGKHNQQLECYLLQRILILQKSLTVFKISMLKILRKINEDIS